MQGLKIAILAIFQTGPGWPCTVSAALKNPSQISKIIFALGSYELKLFQNMFVQKVEVK